ncbi:hypothetical protein L7F22_056113 [Adiantum nelumboides]|nr:hypothetical protein [Adiantum nelumboides]
MVAEQGVFPVRVIDVKKSLDSEGGIVFRAPKDWNFHTVSHTWSLEIRQLSEEVGNRVLKEAQIAAGDIDKEGSTSLPVLAGSTFEDVFKQAKLDHRVGYLHFAEFLKMLHADGVESIWFDALCINQTDQKAREITHMGAFYYHSVGCYVVAHGFGRGFHLMDSNDELTRWFSRVWTLQEMLLSKSLSFIVQMSNEELHGVIRSVRRDHVMGFCDCKVGESGSLVWPWGFANPMEAGSRWSENYDERVRWFWEVLLGPVQEEDEEEFWRQLEMSGYKCTRGRLQKVVYDIHARSRSTVLVAERSSSAVYFVHVDAYVHILEGLRKNREHDASLFHTGHRTRHHTGKVEPISRPDVQVISDLMRRFEVLQRGGHPAVVREISARNCSNDEDRVLAVLALLGLDGKMLQLRTTETLDEQMLQMCRTMAKCNPGNLMRLCSAFARPYITKDSAACLSWAPHFKARDPEESRSLVDAEGQHAIELDHLHQLIGDFRHTVANLSVGPRGLSLSCHMLKARLVSSLAHANQCTAGAHLFSANSSSKMACCACSNYLADHAVLQIADGGHAVTLGATRTPSQEILLSAVQIENPRGGLLQYCRGGMVLLLDSSNEWVKLPHILKFNVWLLLLGTYNLDRQEPKQRVVLVFMVCFGERRDNLHKIGILQMLPTYLIDGGRSTIRLESFASVDCTVGGFTRRHYNTWLLKQIMSWTT